MEGMNRTPYEEYEDGTSFEQLEEALHARLAELIYHRLPEGEMFVSEMDFEDALNYVYETALKSGQDPDTLLKEFGIIEGGDENEV